MSRNPNPGEQCACSPHGKVVGCNGPFLVLTHTEAMNPRAPHIVIGSDCMKRGVEKLHPGAFKVKTVEVRVPAPETDVEAVLAAVRAALPTPAK